MNLLSFAAAGMVPSMGSGGGNGDNPPPKEKITLSVDADTRTPKANPDSGWVKPGGEILWVSSGPFEIILKLMWSGLRISRTSEPGEGGMHEVRVKAGSINGRYTYGFKLEGFPEVDPDVVIGPKAGN